MIRVMNKSFNLQKSYSSIISRAYSQQQTSGTKVSSQPAPNANVPGLSEKCVKVPNQPVGPGATKQAEYKNPEYFCYHVSSFAEAEVELAKYRLPAPSNKEKFTR